ncbi:LSDV004 [Lumpy skin disease virus]|nr:LSDV004 [Lumpy skin disease virus]
MIGLINPYNMITSSTKNLFSFNINPFRQKKKSFSFLSYINPFKKEEKKKGLFSSFFS